MSASSMNGSIPFWGDLTDIIRRRGKLIICVFLATSIPIVLVSLFKPLTYTASAKLLAENNRRVNLEMSGPLSERAEKLVMPAERLNSKIEMLKSGQIITQLVQLLGLANTPEEAARERERLQRQIQARVIPASTIIEITYSDRNPEMATRVVNTLTDLFQREHLKVIEGDEVLEFYQDQLRMNAIKLQKDHSRLNELRQQVGVLSNIADEQKKIHDNVVTLESQMIDSDLKVEVLNARINYLNDLKTKQPEMIKSGVEIVPNPAASAMAQRITQLELENQSLLTKYMEDAREIQDRKQEIIQINGKLRKTPANIIGRNIMAVNPTLQAINHDLANAETELEGLIKSNAAIHSKIASYQQKLIDLNEHAYEFAALENAVAVGVKEYSFYLGKLTDAQFVDSMNRNNITTLSLIQSAQISQPENRTTMFSLLLAPILGALLAFTIAFMLDWLRPTLTNGEQVRDLLKVPVLATISDKQP